MQRGHEKVRLQKHKQKIKCKLCSSISKLVSDFIICEEVFFPKFILEIELPSKLYDSKTEIEARM